MGVPTSALAIAALARLASDTTMIPLVGARTVAQLQENIACLNVTLDDAHLERPNAATAIALGRRTKMLDNDFMRRVSTGDTSERLERKRHG